MSDNSKSKMRRDTNRFPSDHPLLTLDNCLIMPHVASATGDTRMKMAMMCVENVLAGIAGDWPPYCVNQAEIAGNARLKS
ncbi:MAG: hypothetical protein V3T49_04685 [Dehalococcoidia bacterium]